MQYRIEFKDGSTQEIESDSEYTLKRAIRQILHGEVIFSELKDGKLSAWHDHSILPVAHVIQIS